MHKHSPPPRSKKSYLFYLIILLFIYPLSSFLFTSFLDYKEPEFLSPIIVEGKMRIRSDIYGKGHFGAKRSGGRRLHKGLDIRADIGEPVRASKSGVVSVEWEKGGMGKYVRIIHPRGYSTLYGHLSKTTAKNNHWAWQGEEIGRVGRTGNAKYKRMRPHLHFEIRHNNIHLDPLKFLQEGQ